MKVAMQVWFCKVTGENGKKTLPEIFLSYQKRISCMDVLMVLQLSADDFWVRTKRGKQQHCQKLKQIRYFNIFKACFPPRWAPLPILFAGDKFGENYQRFVFQPSLPAMSMAMNIKRFWYSLPKSIA